MIEIVPMAEEHINGVVTLEEATFSIPWTRADFEREVRENTMAIYYVALMDGSSRLCRDVACSNRRTYHKRGRTGGGTL